MSGVIEGATGHTNFQQHMKSMEKTLEILENNIKESNEAHSQVIMSLNTDKINYQGISNELDEARKENQQLLEIIQNNTGDIDITRANSQIDISSPCSTMSIVHLQYRYEELMASHHGLLKLLESKSNDLKRITEENIKVRAEIEKVEAEKLKLVQKLIRKQSKYSRIKEKKNAKIRDLKMQIVTLQQVHDQLVDLLDDQCMERNSLLCNEIRNSLEPDKALLLEEIRKNHTLTYQNFYLSQEIQYLKSLLPKDSNVQK